MKPKTVYSYYLWKGETAKHNTPRLLNERANLWLSLQRPLEAPFPIVTWDMRLWLHMQEAGLSWKVSFFF